MTGRLLAAALIGALAWLILGYVQWDVHQTGRRLPVRGVVALHVGEFTSAATCLFALIRLTLEAAR